MSGNVWGDWGIYEGVGLEFRVEGLGFGVRGGKLNDME